jgi:serine/threonine protein kinase
MTDIFVATDAKGQRVVLRCMKETYAKERRLRKKFIEGAKILERMVHPNIVRLLDHGMRDRIPFMVLEYHEAAPLRDFLVRRDPDIQYALLPLVRQMAAALYFCHHTGYMHLDFKPENLLIHEDGRVVLIDFDLATRIHRRPVRLRDYPGTPAYTAPEVMTTQRVDERADIFSFGVTCYEMITFHKPFERDTLEDSRRAQIDPDVLPLSVEPFTAHCPPALAALVFKCLAKDLSKRYPAMSLVIKAIEDIT